MNEKKITVAEFSRMLAIFGEGTEAEREERYDRLAARLAQLWADPEHRMLVSDGTGGEPYNVGREPKKKGGRPKKKTQA